MTKREVLQRIERGEVEGLPPEALEWYKRYLRNIVKLTLIARGIPKRQAWGIAQRAVNSWCAAYCNDNLHAAQEAIDAVLAPFMRDDKR